MKARLFVLILLITCCVLPLGDSTIAEDVRPQHSHAPIRGNGPRVLTSDSSGIELVGQIAGTSEAVAVRGYYAYVGVGPRLVVLDISDPGHPQVIGRTTVLRGVVWDLAVVEDHVYVAAWDAGLRIISVADPANPAEVGFLDAPGWSESKGVTVVGNYAYVADGYPGVRIVDVSDPANPSEVGVCDTPGDADDVVVAGSYAYVAAFSQGLRIIDISSPWSPIEVGFYNTPGWMESLALAGNHVYAADGSPGLRIIDVTDRTNPSEVGVCDTPGYARGIAVKDGLAYVADSSGGLRVIDISSPAQPTEIGHWGAATSARSVALAGNHAYVADEAQGLRVIDISDPAHPTETSFYDDTPGLAANVAVSDAITPARGATYAYVSAWSSGLRVISTLDPAYPSEAGVHDTPGSAYEAALFGHHAYVADGNKGLRIVDISDLGHPTEVGSYDDRPGQTSGVAVSGDYTYVVNQDSGLHIVDVSNPRQPQGVGQYHAPGGEYATDVAVAGHYAYVADYPCGICSPPIPAGLRVIDVSDPMHPSSSGFCETPGWSWSVAVQGDYAYFANGYDGLRIIDVSDPAHPTVASSYQAGQFVAGVAVAGRHAFVADGYAGLKILDVSDALHPVLAASFDTPGYANAAAVSGSYVYVADREAGLLILWFSRAASTPIPSSGGTLLSPTDSTSYAFPPMAFADTAVVTHIARSPSNVPSPPGSHIGIGHFFEVSAVFENSGDPAEPTTPYTVTVGYTDPERGPAIESSLALYAWDGEQWVKEPSSTVDATANLITARPNHLSLWAVFGETRSLYMPFLARTR